MKRLLESKLKERLNCSKAVCIEGPRAAGKTTLASNASKSKILLREDSAQKRLATLDNSFALKCDKPHLIDEWQEIPSLWDAVRFEVDKTSDNGQYILTGSSTPARKGIMHSGTGRISLLNMRTMSLYESGESTGEISLSGLFKENIKEPIAADNPGLETLAYYIIRGGWPSSIDLPKEEASLFATGYVNGLLQEDIPRVAASIDITKMHQFMRSLARNESTTASKRVIMKDMNGEISDATINSYTDILTRLFLLSPQLPFSPSVRSSLRVKQMEKRHFTDPSIAAALMGLRVESLMKDLKTFGFLFESLVERDLAIYASATGSRLMHYQDYKDNEIDAIIEAPDGSWGAIEIKLGAGEIDAGAKSLLRVNKTIKENSNGNGASFLAVICGLTSYGYRREDGVNVIPITALGI